MAKKDDELAKKDAEIERLRKEKEAAERAAKPKPGIKVRATAKGYYGCLRQEGDVFEIEKKEDMGSWMEIYKPAKVVVEEDASTEATGDEDVI